MKKKILPSILVAVMIATTLIGCGNTDNTPNENTTNNSTENTENSGNTETESDDTISGSVGDITGETTTEDTTEETKEVLVKLYKFPRGIPAKGYTKKTIEDENVDWSVNETYIELENGKIMTFKWESKVECGSRVYAAKNTAFLENSKETIKLIAGTNGWSTNIYENVKNSTKENIVSGNTDYKYIENGYYDEKITDTTIRITFAIDSKEKEAKGYACYIVDTKHEIVYQFNYVESYKEYNDTRAFDVVNSIEYVELTSEPNIE